MWPACNIEGVIPLSIRTPLSSLYQVAALSALRKNLEAYDKRHGWRGAIKNFKEKDWLSRVKELKVDQSVAHDGVCLTTVKIEGDVYTVTAIKETLDKSNLNHLKIGDLVNLERTEENEHIFEQLNKPKEITEQVEQSVIEPIKKATKKKSKK